MNKMEALIKFWEYAKRGANPIIVIFTDENPYTDETMFETIPSAYLNDISWSGRNYEYEIILSYQDSIMGTDLDELDMEPTEWAAFAEDVLEDD